MHSLPTNAKGAAAAAAAAAKRGGHIAPRLVGEGVAAYRRDLFDHRTSRAAALRIGWSVGLTQG
eukprot:11655307-Alexandrium_andersonii.AAC.1